MIFTDSLKATPPRRNAQGNYHVLYHASLDHQVQQWCGDNLDPDKYFFSGTSMVFFTHEEDAMMLYLALT